MKPLNEFFLASCFLDFIQHQIEQSHFTVSIIFGVGFSLTFIFSNKEIAIYINSA